MTYAQYIEFINHLFLQRMVDESYLYDTGSTANALEVL